MVAPGPLFQIVFKPKALADIEEIRSYIAVDSPQNADEIAVGLLEAAESLNLFPTRFKIHQRRSNPAMSVRSMPVPPYRIYYRVDELGSVVTILTVRHGARRQPKRFR